MIHKNCKFVDDILTRYELMHPEIYMVIVKVVSNISRKGDYIARTKNCCELGSISNYKESHKH